MQGGPRPPRPAFQGRREDDAPPKSGYKSSRPPRDAFDGDRKPAFKKAADGPSRPPRDSYSNVERKSPDGPRFKPAFKKAADAPARPPRGAYDSERKPVFKSGGDAPTRAPRDSYGNSERKSADGPRFKPAFKKAGDAAPAAREGYRSARPPRDSFEDDRKPAFKKSADAPVRPSRKPYSDDRKPAFKKAGDAAPAARESYRSARPPRDSFEDDRKPAFKKSADAPARPSRKPYSDDRKPAFKKAGDAPSRPSRDFSDSERKPAFQKAGDGPPPKRGIGFRSGPPPAGVERPMATVTPKTQGKRPLKTLERVLSKAGVCSRTEARSHIGAGRVEVNGHVVRTPDFWVDLGRDRVMLDGEPVSLKDRTDLYLVLNKPKGYITTFKDPEGRPTIYELINDLGEWVVPVGRLDQDTTGLLLMTNDTQFAERLTNPDFKVRKTYLIKASTQLSDEQLDQLRKGVDLSDGPTRPATVTRLRDSGKYTHFEMTITEGRNRQVRRMVEAVGSKVLKLVRVQIGDLKLEGLEIGKWRRLSPQELENLR